MASFDKKLRTVFEKGTPIGEAPTGREAATRYVPRAIDGGPAWQVYDLRKNRFLTNREVKKLPLEALRDEPLFPN